jgi:hypothetical protein
MILHHEEEVSKRMLISGVEEGGALCVGHKADQARLWRGRGRR